MTHHRHEFVFYAINFLSFGNVYDYTNIPDDDASIRTERGSLQMHPVHLTGGSHEAELFGKLMTCRHLCVPLCKHGLSIFGMDGMRPAVAQTLLQRQPRDLLPPRVGIDTDSRGIILEDTYRRSGT